MTAKGEPRGPQVGGMTDYERHRRDMGGVLFLTLFFGLTGGTLGAGAAGGSAWAWLSAFGLAAFALALVYIVMTLRFLVRILEKS